MASLVPVGETLRSGTREGLHFGALAVADAGGRVLAHAGDAHWLTFTRSTLKPLQALPFVDAGGALVGIITELVGFDRLERAITRSDRGATRRNEISGTHGSTWQGSLSKIRCSA